MTDSRRHQTTYSFRARFRLEIDYDSCVYYWEENCSGKKPNINVNLFVDENIIMFKMSSYLKT